MQPRPKTDRERAPHLQDGVADGTGAHSAQSQSPSSYVPIIGGLWQVQ